MSKNTKRNVPELRLGFSCSMAHCGCEGTKMFVDRPREFYCSDCFETINSLRLRKVVPS